jgi:hypothetical protein
MTGPTIDHMVSITVLVAALMLTFGLYNQILASAFAYQRNHQVVMKAVDLMNTICLGPGNPTDWGQSNVTPTCFGLQDPDGRGYALSPFSLMKLLSSSGEKVYYNITGEWYSNISWGLDGGYLLLPIGECVDYATVSRLLGTNGSYGFQLSVTPTLSISISEVQVNPLELSVEVRGPGSPLSGATLNYLMYWTLTEKDPETGCPLFNFTSGSSSTNSAGLASLDFPQINVNNNRTAYTIIVNAQLGGLYGVGYKSRETITSAGNIIPFVESYENGTVLLAHKWGKNDPDGNQGALHFNATFYIISDNFAPINVDIENSTGLVNYGKGGKPFHQIQIPTSNAGFLIVSYCRGNEFGMVIMPWGISTIGLSLTFGGDPSGHSFVATELRQVVVNELSYQVKLSVWSLNG